MGQECGHGEQLKDSVLETACRSCASEPLIVTAFSSFTFENVNLACYILVPTCAEECFNRVHDLRCQICASYKGSARAAAVSAVLSCPRRGIVLVTPLSRASAPALSLKKPHGPCLLKHPERCFPTSSLGSRREAKESF